MEEDNPPIFFSDSFANSSIETLKAKHDCAYVIVPSEDNWNDFSLKILFQFAIVSEQEGISRIRDIVLAFIEDESNTRYILDKKIKESSYGLLPADEFLPFFTMLTEMEGYREFVSSAGPQEARQHLLNINDLVAHKGNTSRPKWFTQAINSEAFNLSFMRWSERFFTYYNAESILDGVLNEKLSGITKGLNFSFRLPTFENDHIISISFSDTALPSSRIAVIIGENGTGKSQSLRNLTQLLISGSSNITDESGERPLINRLIAITSPGETKNTFPPPKKRSEIYYRRLHLGKNKTSSKDFGFGEVLIQLARSKEKIKGVSKWNLFTDAIHHLIALKEIFVKRKTGEASPERVSSPDNFLSLSEMLSGGEKDQLKRWGSIDPKTDLYRYFNKKAVPLSSGQSTFIRFTAQACLHIENGTLFLFDEPETHLHPTMVTHFVSLLDRLLESSGSAAVLATHSAYFVREIPRTQVTVLQRKEGNMINAVTPRLRTLGADIGEISQFVFGDALFGRLKEAFTQKLESESLAPGDLISTMENELSSEAWMYLKREFGDYKK